MDAAETWRTPTPNISARETAAVQAIQGRDRCRPWSDDAGDRHSEDGQRKATSSAWEMDSLDRVLDDLGIYEGFCVHCYGKSGLRHH